MRVNVAKHSLCHQLFGFGYVDSFSSGVQVSHDRLVTLSKVTVTVGIRAKSACEVISYNHVKL